MKKYLFGPCLFTLLPLAQAQASGAGSALSFDGIDDQVVASSASLTLTTSLTFEAWVFPQEARCNTIISRGDGGGNSDYIFQVGYAWAIAMRGRSVSGQPGDGTLRVPRCR